MLSTLDRACVFSFNALEFVDNMKNERVKELSLCPVWTGRLCLFPRFFTRIPASGHKWMFYFKCRPRSDWRIMFVQSILFCSQDTGEFKNLLLMKQPTVLDCGAAHTKFLFG